MVERLDDATREYLLQQLKDRQMAGETFTEAEKANIELRYPGFFDDQELTQSQTQTPPVETVKAYTPQTDVSSILKDKEEKDKVSNAIDRDQEERRKIMIDGYTSLLGVNPYIDPDDEFNRC